MRAQRIPCKLGLSYKLTKPLGNISLLVTNILCSLTYPLWGCTVGYTEHHSLVNGINFVIAVADVFQLAL